MGFIRLILALAVLVGHTVIQDTIPILDGYMSVKMFYIISGFYITLILNEKYIQQDGSYRLFISNRFLRLYPIYWAVLFLIIASSLIIYWRSGFSDLFLLNNTINLWTKGSIVTNVFAFCSNAFMFFLDVGMFLAIDDNGNLFFTSNFWIADNPFYIYELIPQAWTVGLELTFYILAPFIARRKLKWVALFISLSLFIKFLLLLMGYTNDPWLYRFFPSEFHLFLFGTISYKLYKYITDKKIEISQIGLYCIYGLNIINIFSFRLLPLSLFRDYYVLITFTVSIPFIFSLTKKMRLDNKIGELSYPIYIIHIFTLAVIQRYNQLIIVNSILITNILFTVILSFILIKYISDPIEKIRQRRVKHRIN